MIECACTN